MISGRGEGVLLAWKLGSRGRVDDEVVVPSNIVGGSRGVYWRRRGEETVNIKQTIYKTYAWQYAVLVVPNRNARCTARSGKSSGDNLPALGDYRTRIPEGNVPCSVR